MADILSEVLPRAKVPGEESKEGEGEDDAMEEEDEEEEEDLMLTMAQGKPPPLEAIDARIPHFERLAEKLLQVRVGLCAVVCAWVWLRILPTRCQPCRGSGGESGCVTPAYHFVGQPRRLRASVNLRCAAAAERSLEGGRDAVWCGAEPGGGAAAGAGGQARPVGGARVSQHPGVVAAARALATLHVPEAQAAFRRCAPDVPPGQRAESGGD